MTSRDPGSAPHTLTPKGARRRAAILDALERLLETHSLNDISIADISRAAGVTRSGFYLYFDTKAIAVAELSRIVYREFAEDTQVYLDIEGDPRSSIDAMVGRVIETWQRHANLYRAMRDARDSDPTVREMWEADRHTFVEPVAATIDAERAAGRAIEGPDSRALAIVLLNLNDSTVQQLSRGADGLSIEAAREVLGTVWLNTIYGTERR